MNIRKTVLKRRPSYRGVDTTTVSGAIIKKHIVGYNKLMHRRQNRLQVVSVLLFEFLVNQLAFELRLLCLAHSTIAQRCDAALASHP